MNDEKQIIEEMVKLLWHFPKALYLNCYNDCEEVAKLLYEEDYRKQRKGEWVFDFTLDGDDFYKCSVCGRQVVINRLCGERNPAKHCPYCHCGAKMKGGVR